MAFQQTNLPRVVLISAPLPSIYDPCGYLFLSSTEKLSCPQVVVASFIFLLWPGQVQVLNFVIMKHLCYWPLHACYALIIGDDKMAISLSIMTFEAPFSISIIISVATKGHENLLNHKIGHNWMIGILALDIKILTFLKA